MGNSLKKYKILLFAFFILVFVWQYVQRSPAQPCYSQHETCPVTNERVADIAREKGAAYATTSDVTIKYIAPNGSWRWLYNRKMRTCDQCTSSLNYVESFEVDPMTGEEFNITNRVCYTCDMARRH